MKQVVIVASAPWTWEQRFVALVRSADEVLAADGGANHLARIGIRPTKVVGDLDSIRPSVRRWVGEERMVARPDQDSTDLDKTLAYAFDDCGAGAVTVLAATSGRLDHALENLGLLARWCRRGPLELFDGLSRIVPVESSKALETRPGQAVSLMPVGRCDRVWSKGLHWELAGGPLDLMARTGVSNRTDAAQIEIRVEGGMLLVFLFA